jgi:hypothetical protein
MVALVVDPAEGVDLCAIDPGFDVDLYVSADLRAMTAIWMGYETVRHAIDRQKLIATGDPRIADHMQRWLGLSPFAKHARLVA